jgi:hypothetical protein
VEFLRKRFKRTAVVLAVGWLALFQATTEGWSQTVSCPGGLFTVSNAKPADRTHPAVVRQRAVTVNLAQVASSPDRLTLNLFDDVCLVARRDASRSDPATGVWAGTIEGWPDGTVTLVIRGEALVGSVSSPPRSFQIQYYRDGVHLVNQVDASKFPPEMPPTAPRKPPGA